MRNRTGFVVLMLVAGVLSARGQNEASSPARTLPPPESVSPTQAFPSTIPIIQLRASGEPSITPQALAPVYGSIRCDQSGGVFLTIAEDLKQPLSGPIVRLSRRSRSAVKFDLHRVPDFGGRELRFTQFSVAPDGEVYVLVTVGAPSDKDAPAQYLVAFSNDGSYRWKSSFATRFDAIRFVALPSGDFFVSGLDPSSPQPAAHRRRAFTAIMDADGKIKRELSSKEEREGYEADPKVPTVADSAITFADAQLGPDGHIYVLKPALEPVVEVRSQTGSKVRQLRLKSPIAGARPTDLKVTQGSFSLTFQGPKAATSGGGTQKRKVEIVTFNSTSGEPIARYQRSDSLKGMLGCYEKDNFTYVVPYGTNFALVKADAEP